MKTIVNVIAVALVVAMQLVLAVGPVSADCAVGTNREWDGSEDNLWKTDLNWVGGSAPSYPHGMVVCLPHEQVGDNICEYDTYFGNILWAITLFGESPTFFTFNITADICPSSFDLQDYSSLDVDDCVDVTGSTDLSGRVKIDVATTPSGFVDCCLGNADVEEESAELDLTGQVKFVTLTIAADQGDQNIRMTLDDGGTLLADEIRIKAEVDTGQPAYIAELHLKDGLITTNDLLIWAGQSTDRRVSLDLDDNMTVRNKTTLAVFPGGIGDGGGRVAIDLTTGITFDTGELQINGPCILKVTGIDTTTSPGQLQSSTNEEASDNTCSCTCS